MARYDKYDPKDGGFRARLAEDFDDLGLLEEAIPVSLDGSGHVVLGTGGASGFVGVMVLTQVLPAGAVVDIMTDGEIVEFDGSPGTVYHAGDANALVAAGEAGAGTRVGHTVEEDRLVVRIARG